MTLLEVDQVVASYGPYRALHGVSMAVADAQVVAVLGPNGAGKSTLARVVAGLVHPKAGRVVFQGRETTTTRAAVLARAGLVCVNEGRAVFADLTVEENLSLGRLAHLGRRARAAALGAALEGFPALAAARARRAGLLSGGEQRQLALVRALLQQPRLLVADELSLGLSPQVTEQIYRTLHAVKAEGMAMVLIEQRVEHLVDLADAAVVLRRGRVAATGNLTEGVEALERQVTGLDELS